MTRWQAIIATVVGVSIIYIAAGGLSHGGASKAVVTDDAVQPAAQPRMKRARAAFAAEADFVHGDPAWKERCQAFEKDSFIAPPARNRVFSQVLQDWFMYENYFRGHGPGFFVDVGSNDPEKISNSIFFEKCLGWQGLCIEPNPQYHPGYASRSCKLIPNCVSDIESSVHFDASLGTGGHIISNGGINVQCRPLQVILREHGVKRIDWLSLDIEGFEQRVLKTFPFDEFDIQLWLMETMHIDPRTTDQLMLRAGFAKVANLWIDDLYERTDHKLKQLPYEIFKYHTDDWTTYRASIMGEKTPTGWVTC